MAEACSPGVELRQADRRPRLGIFERVWRCYQVEYHVQIDRMKKAFLQSYHRNQLTVCYQYGKDKVLHTYRSYTQWFQRSLIVIQFAYLLVLKSMKKERVICSTAASCDIHNLQHLLRIGCSSQCNIHV